MLLTPFQKEKRKRIWESYSCYRATKKGCTANFFSLLQSYLPLSVNILYLWNSNCAIPAYYFPCLGVEKKEQLSQRPTFTSTPLINAPLPTCCRESRGDSNMGTASQSWRRLIWGRTDKTMAQVLNRGSAGGLFSIEEVEVHLGPNSTNCVYNEDKFQKPQRSSDGPSKWQLMVVG